MEHEISIIPRPFSIEEREEQFSISDSFLIIKEPLSSSLKTSISNLLSNIGINYSFSASAYDVNLIQSKEYNGKLLNNSESYYLDVEENGICLYASSNPGFFYGFVSIAQLVMTYKTFIPCVTIYDKPAFQWRGFLLDTSRSFYTVDFIKKVIDLCAFHKLNTFHWHLTDDQGWRLPIEGYPLLTEIGSQRMAARKPKVYDGMDEDNVFRRRYYTEDEIKEVVKYAGERFVNIVPEIELPGHVSALLAAYPEFGCTGGPYQVEHRWGIFPDILCSGNDKIFELYDAIFASVAKLFPGKYVHIGGDECRTARWQRCQKCQKRMKEEHLDNTNQLQTWVTAKMVKILEKYNKTPIGWDEVLENTEKISVPDDLIVQSWRGIEGGERATNLQHKVIMSPQTMCYLNLKPYDNFEEPGMLGYTTMEKAYEYSPVTKGMSPKNTHLVLGGECALWTEEIRSSRLAEYLMFPRFCAISECLWLSESDKDFDKLLNNMKDHKKRLDKLDVLYYKGPAK